MPRTSSDPAHELSDRELVRACRQGDRGAWERLVRRYARLVHGIAHRAGLPADEAADHVQSVFTVAYRSLPLLDSPGALSGWLATIARREAWRRNRKRRREREREETAVEDPSTRDDLVPSTERPDEALERAERAFLVERGIDHLDDRCRTLLRMLFYENPVPSYEEVAQRLDVPVGSVGPTRGRCLEKLRRALEASGF